MPNALSKVFAIFITVVLLFVFPMKNELERQDETSRMFVLNETAGLVDSVRNLGYLSPDMYEKYLDKLALTGNLYKVELEHAALIVYPVYDSSGNPVPGDYLQTYKNTYEDVIEECLFPLNNPLTGKAYDMKKGDYFCVRVVNQNKTTATKLQELLYGRAMRAEKIFVTYGGMIKDESD
ncbi:MAG: hypothetical protein GX567_03935 [Clostridia bacterium]|nr:hypothetical protein [Clostridia bacterium]